jgi:hypothetical protein
LDLARVPPQLKLRSRLGDYLYIRDCYAAIIADIMASLPVKHCKTFAILGTAGIGKSAFFLVVLKLLLEDPENFGLTTRSFYFQTVPGVIWLYRHVRANDFSVCIVERGTWLDASIPLFADMEDEQGSPKEHAGVSLIFTSFRLSHYKELTKMGWQKVMPTWSAEEQGVVFNSAQFQSEHGEQVAQRAYDNCLYFGGSIRNNINFAITGESPIEVVERAIMEKGQYVVERFFRLGFGGTEDVDVVWDFLVHRNPKIVAGVYNFGSKAYVFSFASPYVLRRLLSLNNNMLVTDVRNKYVAGTFRGGDEGNEFERLCLHGFKISDVEFDAQPLTENAQPTKVKFPPKQVLALNWRQSENYLEANVLYIPPYGNLESGDAFCLIEINGRWTVVIIQCTIAENHPVKQNDVKIIYDCYAKNQELKVDDTVIIFMIPAYGKLKVKQPLVTSKNGGELEEAQRVTVPVTAQYKIEIALSL